MLKKINITIDGYSSCGKGTLAKVLAQSLGYVFIDTGAMYRALTLALVNNAIPIEDTEAVANLLPSIKITFKHLPEDNFYHTILNGVDVENEIRTMEISNLVSPVSKIQIVRDFLVAQQKAIGENKGVVMDGRDIGTVVFPNAELKIFMTAKPEIRAERRLRELQQSGNLNITFDEVLKNLNERDFQDSNRKNSPLLKAVDAIEIDNSYLTKEEQLKLAIQLANDSINSN